VGLILVRGVDRRERGLQFGVDVLKALDDVPQRAVHQLLQARGRLTDPLHDGIGMCLCGGRFRFGRAVSGVDRISHGRDVTRSEPMR